MVAERPAGLLRVPGAGASPTPNCSSTWCTCSPSPSCRTTSSSHQTLIGSLETALVAGDGVAGVGLHDLGDQLARPRSASGPAHAVRPDAGQPDHVRGPAAGVRGAGPWIGVAYAAMQIGRSAFAVVALRGERLERNFERILAWCLVSGSLRGRGRAGPRVEPRGPGGWQRSPSTCSEEWSASTRRGSVVRPRSTGPLTPAIMAERCQAFLLIALGESVVVMGAALSEPRASRWGRGRRLCGRLRRGGRPVVGLFRSQRRGRGPRRRTLRRPGPAGPVRLPSRSSDHGRGRDCRGRGRSTGAGPPRGVANGLSGLDGAREARPCSWLGHSAFKAIIWRVVPWSRLVAIVVLGLLAPAATRVSSLALAWCVAAVVVGVVVADRFLSSGDGAAPSPG